MDCAPAGTAGRNTRRRFRCRIPRSIACPARSRRHLGGGRPMRRRAPGRDAAAGANRRSPVVRPHRNCPSPRKGCRATAPSTLRLRSRVPPRAPRHEHGPRQHGCRHAHANRLRRSVRGRPPQDRLVTACARGSADTPRRCQAATAGHCRCQACWRTWRPPQLNAILSSQTWSGTGRPLRLASVSGPSTGRPSFATIICSCRVCCAACHAVRSRNSCSVCSP